MWCTIPASVFLRRLVALGAGLLVATLLAVLVGALPVAHATHAPDCFGKHPTNPVVPGPGGGQITGTPGNDVLAGGPGDDVIQGLGGTLDRLCGNGGADIIEGG